MLYVLYGFLGMVGLKEKVENTIEDLTFFDDVSFVGGFCICKLHDSNPYRVYSDTDSVLECKERCCSFSGGWSYVFSDEIVGEFGHDELGFCDP